jgi:POT family proton-dependent oligopeptide transporter
MTTQTPDAARSERTTETFFGHPRGLFFLFSTELWERYAYYGMVALLTLYMVNYLFLPGHVEHVLGYWRIKSIIESVYGPQTIQGLASLVYGIYGFLVYFAPFFGGIVADQVLGQRKAVLLGAVLLSAGYFLMSIESMFFLSFPLVFIGNGLFKPNISTQVGNLYAPGDHKRDRAFSIFYVGINIGGVLGPFICGTLGEDVAWAYGFIAAGIGLAGGVIIYLYGLRHLPADALTQARQNTTVHPPFTARDWKSVGALVFLAVVTSFFWGVWYLQFNIMNLWADVNTERHIGLIDFTIPTTWFQMVNGIFIFALTPLVTSLWARQERRGREPSTAAKMGIGGILLGLSFIFMLLPVAVLGPDGKTNMLWLIAFYGIYTAGELYFSPIGLALVTKVAPKRIVSMMMGVWLASYAVGNLEAGWIGSYWEKMSKSSFFLVSASIPIVAGLAVLAASRRLKPILESRPGEELGPEMVLEPRPVDLHKSA